MQQSFSYSQYNVGLCARFVPGICLISARDLVTHILKLFVKVRSQDKRYKNK